MTRRWPVGVAALLLLAPLAAGCAEDDPFEAYCSEVEAQQAGLSEVLAPGDRTALLDALPSFRRLAEKAPEDLRDEWRTVTTRLEALQEALEEAGVDPASYDREAPPAGLDRAERRAIDAAARGLATPEMQAALDGVQQQARDVCKTPLFL